MRPTRESLLVLAGRGLRFTAEVVGLSVFGVGLMAGIAASYVLGVYRRPEPPPPPE